MPRIYIIGTPIGNLEDITLRALRVLKEADIILCEDTRVTARLLLRHGIIGKKLLTYNEKRSGAQEEKVSELLQEGKTIALVTDSGTPGISDPGTRLVSFARKNFKDTVAIVPIPGPAGVTAALSASGISAQQFLFLGFLPHKKGKETIARQISEEKRTVVFYESPYRIVKTLALLSARLTTERTIVVAKELTKIHEEIFSGTPEEAYVYFQKNPDKVRGEFIVVVSPR